MSRSSVSRISSAGGRRVVGPAALVVGLVLGGLAFAAPAAARSVAVLHIAQVTAQDVAPQPGSEPDTVVEPDVAVSPVNPNVAVAAAHDGRYPDGGAVGISYSWTHDGGQTWHHQPLPGLTTSTGGPEPWARASDPVVAFAANGDVYISTLLIAETCPSAVAVSRSTDGGVTFAPPVLAHRSDTCAVGDDKNTIVIDNSPRSPHFGRIYQFWTPFLTDPFGNPDGSPQAVVHSDDNGQTWSEPVAVSAPHANTQNSTPMVLPSGKVVDAYMDFGRFALDNEDIEFRQEANAARTVQPTAARFPFPVIRTAISGNGGRSFRPGGVVTRDIGGGPLGIRCCLPSATSDPRTGRMYVAWNAADPSEVQLASSTDGTHWGASQVVSRNGRARLGVNVDVAAFDGKVAVSYGLTNRRHPHGRFAQQFITTSRNSGRSFGTPIPVGPRSVYRYAARAGGIFPGDYIGTAMAGHRLYAVWCVSSKPADPDARFHQVVFGAALRI